MLNIMRTSGLLRTVAARGLSRPFSTQTARFADDKSAFDADKGSIGSKFQHGEAAQAAQKVGGPFDKEGAVGKQFTKDGAIGGTAQEVANETSGEPPAFDKDGSIGKHFKADGAIGSIGEKVGGPFSKDGAIGKQFEADGSIGGGVQQTLGKDKK